MPRTTRHYAPLPPNVLRAIEAVRIPLRVSLIRWLATHPDAQVSEIVAGVGGQRTTIYEHLQALLDLGVVIASHPPGQRERVRVLYRADIDRWLDLVQHLTDVVTLGSDRGR